jgi:pyruvate/2-oxoglutarate dehydrogenase complex dihydrolipoamide acyltransferase (E2) component
MPALADPTPAPTEAPSAAPSAAAEPSPAPAQAAPATSAPPASAPATSVPAASAPPASGSPAPVPAPSADQAVTVRAMDWLHRLQTGNIDRTQITIEFNHVLTPERVKLIAEQLRPLGKVKSYAFVGHAKSHGVNAYQYAVEFAAAKYLYLFEVDEKDQVAGILLSPPK